MITKKLKYCFLAVVLSIIILPVTSFASPLQIVESPQYTGGFMHNLFHTASNSNGEGGNVLAWFDLDKTKSNTYDPDTGILEAYFNVYSGKQFTVKIGSTSAFGELPGANFNNFSGDVAGTINWTFNLTDLNSALNQHLQNEVGGNIAGFYELKLTYLDKFYGVTETGQAVNSWENNYLVLWGADGYDPNLGTFDITKTHLGSDLVLRTAPVPEPVSAILFTTGLIGGIGLRRKKNI